MISKLEVYGIALAAFLIISIGCFYGGDLHGRFAEKTTAMERQEKSNIAAINTYTSALDDRAKEDAAATQRAKDMVAVFNEGIDNAHKKLAALPSTVTVDAHGCPGFTDTARLRWNSIEFLPTGYSDESTGSTPDEPLSTSPVPAPR